MGLSYKNRDDILKVIVTSGLKTFTLNQNVSKYCGFYGIRQTALASCESGAPHSGKLILMKSRVYDGSFDGTVTLKFFINGVAQGIGISVPADTTEDEIISSEEIEFNKEDLLSFEVKSLSGSGNYRFSSYHEIKFNYD